MSATDLLPSPPATSSRRKGTVDRQMNTSTNTPENSSPFQAPSSHGSRKKVEFSPWTDIHKSTDEATTNIVTKLIRPLPPSRDCPSYSKSILKQNQENSDIPIIDEAKDEPGSTLAMLDAITDRLATNEVVLCIEAYQILISLTKSPEDLPEESVLKVKMMTILKHIRKDLSRTEDQASTNVITQALKATVMIAWSTDLSVFMSEEYRAFLLDRSISVISEHNAPKSVIIHHLHFLASQTFRAGTINLNQRASRLLDALKGLTDHVKGNGVITERLLVYHKLLEQARHVMKTKASSWIEELLTGMVSPLQVTRAKAISFGTKACSAFPSSQPISQAVRQALAEELADKKSLSSFMCRRLDKMTSLKEDAKNVPQIWAIVLLLVNGSGQPIDKWVSIKNWLIVIQKCFNCSDVAVRQQASLAWNRFIFIARPHDASDHLAGMVGRPIAAQFERTASDKSSKTSRATGFSSYYNLLYYAFRPASSHKQYNRSWNEYIVKIMGSAFFEKSSANADVASRIFMSLFWKPTHTSRVWNENRAHENTLMSPEELPTIDSKWIRSSTTAILQMFQLLFRYSSWGPETPSRAAYVSQAWSHFLKAIRESACKEIKPSNDTKASLRSIMVFVDTILQSSRMQGSDVRHIHSLDGQQRGHIVAILVEELGLAALLDVIDTENNGDPLDLLSEMACEFLPSELFRQPSQSHVQLFERFSSSADKTLCSIYHNGHAVLSSRGEPACTLLRRILEARLVLSSSPLSSVLTSLTLFIADEHEVIPQTCNESYLSLVSKSLDVVTALQRPDLLEAVLLSAFRSTHSDARDRAANMWRLVCSTKDHDCTAFTNELMTFTSGLQNHRSLCNEIVPYETSLHHTPDTRIPEPLDESSYGRENEAAFTDSRGPEFSIHKRGPATPPHNVPKLPRSRHDDSQIQFVPIDSSPPVQSEPESQFLTDRQKEVRHRQRLEPAVVFSDLRSSPRDTSNKVESYDCEITRRAADLPNRPNTPVLSAQKEITHDDMASSPTPKARHTMLSVVADVPSSPLSPTREVDGGSPQLEDDIPLSSPFPEEILKDIMEHIQTDNTELPFTSSTVISESHVEIGTSNNAVVHNVKADLHSEDETSSAVKCQTDLPANIINVGSRTDSPKNEDSASELPMQQLHPKSEISDRTRCPTADTANQDGASDGASDAAEDLEAILCASQLTNDLDSYVSFASQVSDSQPDMTPIESVSPEVPTKRGSRKRKQTSNPHFERSSKRRSARSSSRSAIISHDSILRSDADVVEEVYDCIVVESKSPRSTKPPDLDCVITDIEHIIVNESSADENRREPAYPEIQVILPGVSHQTQQMIDSVTEQRPAEIAGPSYDESDGSVEPADDQEDTDIHDQTNASDHETSTAACDLGSPDDEGQDIEDETSTEEKVENFAEDVSMEQTANRQNNIVASLQSVLAQLQSSQTTDLDLRAVDELCFQIRFQAQIAMQKM